MSAARLFPPLLAGVGVAGALGYVVVAIVWPHAAAGGWLIAFLFWSSISIGSITALMIHRLTGGAWGRAYAPVFAPAAAAIPFIFIIFTPLLVLLPQLYPWVDDPALVKPDVAHWYLNGLLFAGRSVVAFSGWTMIVIALSWRGRAGLMAAGIGLAFHGLIIGAVGLDWILSLAPPFFSTSFGASLAVIQLIAAFAAAAIAAPIKDPPTKDARPIVSDLGGLLLATILGLTYIDFMAVLIIWYGDLPRTVHWLVVRRAFPWSLIALLAFLLLSVIPTFTLFPGRLRGSPKVLRIIGVVVLCGAALYDAWLVAPAFGPASLLASLFAIIALGALLIALTLSGWSLALVRWAKPAARSSDVD